MWAGVNRSLRSSRQFEEMHIKPSSEQPYICLSCLLLLGANCFLDVKLLISVTFWNALLSLTRWQCYILIFRTQLLFFTMYSQELPALHQTRSWGYTLLNRNPNPCSPTNCTLTLPRPQSGPYLIKNMSTWSSRCHFNLVRMEESQSFKGMWGKLPWCKKGPLGARSWVSFLIQ